MCRIAEPLYMRHGGWCHCQRSCNTATGQLEKGVSVFECEQVDGTKWQGMGHAFEKHAFCFRGQQRKFLGGVGTPWYLVTGEHVGIGGDQEPLLRNVVAQKIVEWDGANYFVEKPDAVPANVCKNHNQYPQCRCDNMDDVLDQI